MATAKEEVEQLLGKLPNDCSLEDIQHHLYVLEKVRNGLEAADTGGGIPQDEAEQWLSKWLN
jgi:predicted transcriptional regulator